MNIKSSIFLCILSTAEYNKTSCFIIIDIAQILSILFAVMGVTKSPLSVELPSKVIDI